MRLQDLISVEITLILLVLFAFYLLLKFWQWHREDEDLKRKDFVKTLKSIHEEQITLTTEIIASHINELKDYIDDADFKNHKERIKTITALIREKLERLDLHKTGDIIHDIRYENVKKAVKNEPN